MMFHTRSCTNYVSPQNQYVLCYKDCEKSTLRYLKSKIAYKVRNLQVLSIERICFHCHQERKEGELQQKRHTREYLPNNLKHHNQNLQIPDLLENSNPLNDRIPAEQ